ncbi:unnamed protein product [Rotaria sp. Silwood1]|nr:unnamed protein product [Rotaria sp. Silwood1]
MITQTQIQTSTIIILSPTASIDYYCYHSLVIQLSKYLIENKNLSNKLFILISKSLSDINHNLIKLILNTKQIWLKYAFNYFLIDFIDNDIYLPNEININNDHIDIDY